MDSITQTILVTIIIPSYNVSSYIQKNIYSCLNQTYKEIEIIAVNDGSTDSTGELLEELAFKNSRLRVIHQHNQGVTAARWVGINQSKGDFIFFLDGDDYLPEDAIETLVKRARETNADIICGNHEVVYSSYYSVVKKRGEYKHLSSQEYYKIVFGDIIYNLCEKLYRKILFENISCNVPKEVKVGEDFLLFIQLINNASLIAKVNDVVYYYVMHSDSAMNSFCFRVQNEYAFLKSFIRVTSSISFSQSVFNRYVFPLKIQLYTKYIANTKKGDIGYFEFYDQLNKEIKENGYLLYKNNSRQYILSLLILKCRQLYPILINIFDLERRISCKLKSFILS